MVDERIYLHEALSKGIASYGSVAKHLKPEIEKAGFTPEQMNLLHKACKGCRALRQGSVIDSFVELLTPSNMEIEKLNIDGKYGPYSTIKFIGVKSQ